MRAIATSFLVVVFLSACSTVVAAPPPSHLYGEVLIQSNGPRTVLAFVAPQRGAEMQVFRITSEQPFPQNPVSLEMPKGQVTMEHDRTTFYDDGQKRIVVFALNEAHVDAPPAGIEQTVLRGFGIGRRNSGAPGLTIAAVRRDRNVVAEFCDASYSGADCMDDGSGGYVGGGTGVTCESGGVGSTSCACSSPNGSCSTSCGSGYYACCRGCDTNAPTCQFCDDDHAARGSHCSATSLFIPLRASQGVRAAQLVLPAASTTQSAVRETT